MASKIKNSKKSVTKSAKKQYTRKYAVGGPLVNPQLPGGPYTGLGVGYMNQQALQQQANLKSMGSDPSTKKAAFRAIMSSTGEQGTLGSKLVPRIEAMSSGKTRVPNASDPRVQQMSQYFTETLPMTNAKLLLNTPGTFKGVMGAIPKIEFDNFGQQIIGGVKAAKNVRSLQKDGYAFAKGGVIPQYGFGTTAAAGAGTLLGGPIGGALVSGAIGLFTNLIGGNAEKKAAEAEARAQREAEKQQYLNTVGAGTTNPYAATFKFGGTFKGKRVGAFAKDIHGNRHEQGGEKMYANGGLIEVEDGETIIGNTVLSDRVKIEGKKSAAQVAQEMGLTRTINKANKGLQEGSTRLTKNSLSQNLANANAKSADILYRQEMKKMAKGGMINGTRKLANGTPDITSYLNSLYPEQRGFLDQMPYLRNNIMPDVGAGLNLGLNTQIPPFQPVPYPNSGTGNGTASNSGVTPQTGRGATMSAPNYLNSNPTPLNPNQLSGRAGFQQTNPDFASQIGPGSGSSNPTAFNRFKGGLNSPTGQNIMGSILGSLPNIYNTIQGLRKPDKLKARDYYNPYNNEIRDTMRNRRYNIDPQLQANRSAQAVNNRNLYNVGTSRGQLMGNLGASQNMRMTGDSAAIAMKQNMDNQYLAEQAGMDYNIGNNMAQTNLGVRQINDQNQAAGRNYLAAAATGFQQQSLVNKQMNNQMSRDELIRQAIMGYSPYAERWIPGLSQA